jgi:glycosyltransferase involved in cell wall biosynthesis
MYNEESVAARCVREVCGVLKTLPQRCELVVVEDGSRDNTRAVLEKVAPVESRLKVIVHEGNRGYGAALRTGAEYAAQATFDYALFMDSDLTNDPSDIPRFINEMKLAGIWTEYLFGAR